MHKLSKHQHPTQPQNLPAVNAEKVNAPCRKKHDLKRAD